MSADDNVLRQLPVPIAATHATGEQDAAAQQEAARVLYFARLIANSAGVPVWQLQRPLPNETGYVKAQVAGPLALKKVHVQAPPVESKEEKLQPPADLVRLVWLPEGFVITPRSKSAPNGWGMPPTKNPDGSQGHGTPGGPLRQVIINRFKNNQYPDALYLQEVKKAGATAKDLEEIKEARKKGTLRICAANMLFMDWELLDEGFGIGIHVPDPAAKGNKNRRWKDKKMIWKAQFKKRFEPEFSEEESNQWYCHRPQNAYESGLQQYLRAQTNIIRAEVNMPPLNPPLRGTAGQLSESPIYMTKYSGVMGHDSYEFREGHISFEMRERRTADDAGHVENIHMQTARIADVPAVNVAMIGWKNSPRHYKNMITDWTYGNEKRYWPSMESAIRYLGEDAEVNKKQNPPYGLDAAYTDFNPPIKPAVGTCQIFSGDKSWITISQTRNLIIGRTNSNKHYKSIDENHFRYFAWKGRALHLGELYKNCVLSTPLAGCEIIENEGVKKIRTAWKIVEKKFRIVFIALVEFYLNHSDELCKEIGRHYIGESSSNIFSIPVFSDSGEKMAFMYDELMRNGIVLEQILYFVEFSNGNFNITCSESVDLEEVVSESKYINIAIPEHSIYIVDGKGNIKKVIIKEAHEVTKVESWTNKNSLEVEWRFLPLYNGENLEYIKCHVNTGMDKITHVTYAVEDYEAVRKEQKTAGNVHFFCEMIWPNGTKFVCYDVKSKIGNIIEGVNGVKYQDLKLYGFVRFLMTMDIHDSAMTSWIELNTDTKFNEWAEVFVMAAGKKIKGPFPAKRNKEGAGSLSGRAFSPFYYKSINVDLEYDYYGLGCYDYSLPLGNKQKAILAAIVARGDYISFYAGDSEKYIGKDGYYIGVDKLYFAPIGPLIASNKESDESYIKNITYEEFKKEENYFNYVKYKDEWIFAGRVDFPVVKNNYLWKAEEGCYMYSSLDLKTITGISDLSDNILPISIIQGVDSDE